MTDLRAFELYLMAHMRGQSKVDSTLVSLGISAGSLREAAGHMKFAVGFFELTARELDAYVRILGEPIETVPEQGLAPGEAFWGSQRHRFRVPLWPDFDLILRTHLAGWVWGPEFVRRPSATVPAVGRVRDLQPWTILESEVSAHFGPFASEVAWNLGKDVTYIVEEAGEHVEIALIFDFALLQSVEIASIDCSHSSAFSFQPR
jgi:hypothetical protein